MLIKDKRKLFQEFYESKKYVKRDENTYEANRFNSVCEFDEKLSDFVEESFVSKLFYQDRLYYRLHFSEDRLYHFRFVFEYVEGFNVFRVSLSADFEYNVSDVLYEKEEEIKRFLTGISRKKEFRLKVLSGAAKVLTDFNHQDTINAILGRIGFGQLAYKGK